MNASSKTTGHAAMSCKDATIRKGFFHEDIQEQEKSRLADGRCDDGDVHFWRDDDAYDLCSRADENARARFTDEACDDQGSGQRHARLRRGQDD